MVGSLYIEGMRFGITIFIFFKGDITSQNFIDIFSLINSTVVAHIKSTLKNGILNYKCNLPYLIRNYQIEFRLLYISKND